MSNRLINEKSPYLLDHAENPVDWFPWGTEAFEKAKREDKPVFLSVGYASCHWCHVMAKESFENTEIAEILNRYFVSVKVDREERPDVDSVYMSACTLMNGNGGWPLTVIMTPEQQPFFAATYIPRESGQNGPGLKALLKAIAAKWVTERKTLLKTAGDIGSYLDRERASDGEKADESFLKNAAAQLAEAYDGEYGGFGSSPKFPTPQNLIFLMRYSALTKDRKAREIVDGTLKAMYRGGIYDHIGGGFCRYSTDREWLAPHFEKMLYDNALLAYTYTEAWQSGRLPLYRTVAENTLDYCMRELLDDEGGYFCAQDADSKDGEGEYYLFTPDEVKKVLGEDTGRHFCECYDILPEGNFRGRSIPNLLLNNRWQLLPEGYDELCERLRLYREERMTLRKDTKRLTAWNGLMLMALSKAAYAFNDARYCSAARELADFMERSFFEKGKLKARLCGGELKYDALLEDYAFYALGLLELYNADRKAEHIARAAALADTLSAAFGSDEGFCYRTSKSAERLIVRPSEIYDGAFPAGNSAAVVLNDLLWRLTGDTRRRDERDRMLNYLCSHSVGYYAGSPFALCALLSAVYPTREILLVTGGEKLPEAFKAVTANYSPELTVLVKTPSQAQSLADIAPFTAAATAKDGKATVYLCENGACNIETII